MKRSDPHLLAVLCCLFWLSISTVLCAQEQDGRGSDAPVGLDKLKETAWNALLEAHNTSLAKGREQKFFAAIQVYEEHLQVGGGDDEVAFQLLILAHTEIARVYEEKKDKAGWQTQYKRAAEVSERIAANPTFSEATRARALGDAARYYAQSGDQEKVQQCKERLERLGIKLSGPRFGIGESSTPSRQWELTPEG